MLEVLPFRSKTTILSNRSISSFPEHSRPPGKCKMLTEASDRSIAEAKSEMFLKNYCTYIRGPFRIYSPSFPISIYFHIVVGFVSVLLKSGARKTSSAVDFCGWPHLRSQCFHLLLHISTEFPCIPLHSNFICGEKELEKLALDGL